MQAPSQGPGTQENCRLRHCLAAGSFLALWVEGACARERQSLLAVSRRQPAKHASAGRRGIVRERASPEWAETDP